MQGLFIKRANRIGIAEFLSRLSRGKRCSQFLLAKFRNLECIATTQVNRRVTVIQRRYGTGGDVLTLGNPGGMQFLVFIIHVFHLVIDHTSIWNDTLPDGIGRERFATVIEREQNRHSVIVGTFHIAMVELYNGITHLDIEFTIRLVIRQDLVLARITLNGPKHSASNLATFNTGLTKQDFITGTGNTRIL